jgi:predicted amidohydrolase YtcJ
MNLKLVGGNVITMQDPNVRAGALAVEGERIVAVGSDREILEFDLAGAKIVDLHGKTVLPGLIDSHVHAFATGLMGIAVDLSESTCVAEVCQALAAGADAVPAGAWLYGLGCSPWILAEHRFPTGAELDALALGRPIYICSSTFHSGATDGHGLRLLRAAMPEFPNCTQDASVEQGWFLDDDTHFAAARSAFGALGDDRVAELYRQVANAAAVKGVTTMHCLEGQFMEGDRDVLVLHALAESLPVNVVLMYQTMDVARALSLGLPRIGGCLTVDGACFEHTACFYEPYLDRPDTRGHLNYSVDSVRDFVEAAHCAGLQIGMHAIGDRAIDVLVAAYSSAMAKHPRSDCRHRIEHFQAPTAWAVTEAQRLGLALTMQPIFSYLWDRADANHYEQAFGPERAARMESFPSLTTAGLVVAGGSDSPVTHIDPLLGVHSAVNNPRPSRRVSVEEALRMFTANGAWVAFQEADRGSIMPGKYADLTIIEGDPFDEPSQIADIPVAMTLCRGQWTFRAAQAG